MLPADVDLGVGWRHEAAGPVWHGVVWGRLGRADLAWVHLDRVHLPALGPWIAAERGRLLREFGLHAAAETIEFPALLAANDPVDEAMLRISLVADAVGQGDADRARRRLRAARDAVARAPDGPRTARQRVRLTWVAIEVAFITGEAPPLDGTPSWDDHLGAPRFTDDLHHGSDFHRAKALLFGGVVRDDDRLLAAAVDLAPPILAWAVHLARADRGTPGSIEAARAGWRELVPPPGTVEQVAATPTAGRLR
ncbi:MAG: hypothetical protein WEB09_06480 [Nitriliruptor sp.]